MSQLYDNEKNENHDSSSEDDVLSPTAPDSERAEKILIKTSSTQDRLTRKRKHTIATLLILGNSILVSKIKESNDEKATKISSYSLLSVQLVPVSKLENHSAFKIQQPRHS